MFKQYRRLGLLLSIFAYIATAPLIVLGFVWAGIFYIVATINKFITMLLDFLKTFLHTEKENMHFAVQIVIYLICLPVIFVLEIFAALISLLVGIIYFNVTIIMFIATLAGITFQPFILEDVERDYSINHNSLGKKGLIFVEFAFVLRLIWYIILISNPSIVEDLFSGYIFILSELSDIIYDIGYFLDRLGGSMYSAFEYWYLIIPMQLFIIIYPIFMFKDGSKKVNQEINDSSNLDEN